MAEAPKIPRLIRERVRAQRAGFRSDQEHPDADLLAAFNENTLAREDRSRVIKHLGMCEPCREVVMLSQSVVEPEAQPGGRPSRPLLSWMTLRWASLAAVFAVAIGVVVVERSTRSAEKGVLLQESTTEGAAVPPSSSNEQERQTSATTVAEPARMENDQKVSDSKVGGKALREPAASSPKAGVAENRIGRPFGGEKRSKNERGALSKGDYFTVPNAIEAKRGMIRNRAQLPVEVGSDFDTQGSGVGSGEAQEAVRPAAPESNVPTFKPVAPPPPASASSEAAPPADVTGGYAPPSDQRLARKKSTDEVTPKSAGERAVPRTLTRDDKALVMQAEAAKSSDDVNFQVKDQKAGLTTENLAAAGPVPMRWRIREGKLEHSADEGKTWQEVNLDPGVNLHSFWIQGGTVWAGGTGGSLFHVTEQGKNAVRIPLKVPGGMDVSQTVITISFSDERNGIIKLENGHILRTNDGGKTWQRF